MHTQKATRDIIKERRAHGKHHGREELWENGKPRRPNKKGEGMDGSHGTGFGSLNQKFDRNLQDKKD